MLIIKTMKNKSKKLEQINAPKPSPLQSNMLKQFSVQPLNRISSKWMEALIRKRYMFYSSCILK